MTRPKTVVIFAHFFKGSSEVLISAPSHSSEFKNAWDTVTAETTETEETSTAATETVAALASASASMSASTM